MPNALDAVYSWNYTANDKGLGKGFTTF